MLSCQRLPNIADLHEGNPWELLTVHPESEGFDGSAYLQLTQRQGLLPTPDPRPWTDGQGHVTMVPSRHHDGAWTHACRPIAGDLHGRDLSFDLLHWP